MLHFQDAPIIEIYKGDQMLYMSSWDEKDVIWNEEQGVLAIKPKRTIYGDMTFLCYEQLQGGERRLLFRYWIHTAFLPTSNEQSNGIGLSTVAGEFPLTRSTSARCTATRSRSSTTC